MKKRYFFALLSFMAILTGCAYSGNDGGNNNPPPIEEEVLIAHKINLNLSEHIQGKLLVNGKEITKAKKGEIVTLELNFDKKYKLKSLSSDDVQFTTVIEGSTYTFVMLDKEIHIDVNDEYIKQINKITINATQGATAKLLVDGKEINEAVEGSKVTLKLSFATRFTLESLTSTDVTFITVSEGEEYSFIMPDKAITIDVKAKYVKQISRINIIHNEEVTARILVHDKEVTEALEGESVTLLLSCNEKYIINSINSIDVTLNEVEANKKYTFIMPDKDVDITITSEYVKQAYSILNIEEYTSSKYDVKGIEVKQKFLEGDKVSFTYNAPQSSSKQYSAYINGTRISGEVIEGKLTFSFVMPQEDVYVVISEETKPSSDPQNSLKVTYNESSDGSYKVYGIINGQGYEYKNYNVLYAYIVPKKGYTLKVEYSLDGGSYRTQSMSNGRYGFYIYNAKTSFDIKITSEFVGIKKINLVNATNVSVVGDLEYTPGDKVKLLLTGINGYQITGIEKTETDNPNVTLYPNYYSGELTFTMPKANVTITLKVVKSISLKATPNDKISTFKFLSSKNIDKPAIESALPGEKVYIYALPVDGYKISKVYYAEELECKFETYYGDPYYSFVMPKIDEINIRFEVIELKTFTYDKTSQIYSISNIYETQFGVGEEVTFSLKAKVGHEITSVKLSDGVTEVKKVSNSKNDYSFIMPNNDVTLVVDSRIIETGTLNFTKPVGVKYAIFKNLSDGNMNINPGEKLNKDTKVSVEFTLQNGYTLESVKLTNGTILTLNPNTQLYEFIMPAEVVDFELTLVETNKNTIEIDTYNDIITIQAIKDNGNTVIATEEGIINGYAGSTITIDLKIKDSHYFTTEGLKVVGNDGTIVSATFKETYSGATITFIMPDQGVKVIPGIKEYTLFAFNKVGEYQDQYKITDINKNEISGAKKGQKVYVRLNMDKAIYSQYSAVRVKVTDDTINSVILDKKFFSEKDYYSFVMPESAVTIEIICVL